VQRVAGEKMGRKIDYGMLVLWGIALAIILAQLNGCW